MYLLLSNHIGMDMSHQVPLLELSVEDHQMVTSLEEMNYDCWEIGCALESLHSEMILHTLPGDVTLESTMVSSGNPLYRIVSAILSVSEKAYETTKTLMKKLVDGRRQLLKKARHVLEGVKRVADDPDAWEKSDLKLPDHLRFLMVKRGQLSANTVIVDIDTLHRGNVNLVDSTINYFKGFERVVDVSDKAGDILNGTLENVTELNLDFLKDVHFDERKKRLGSINYVAPYIGGFHFDVETTTVERKDVLTQFSTRTDPLHRGGTIRATPLSPTVAISLMDAVVNYLSEVVNTRLSREELDKRHYDYKDSLNRLYSRYYKNNVPTHVGNSLAPYINDINRRDVGRRSLQVITNIERHLYRVSLAVLIWVAKSTK